jgi:hypothetical protein
MMCKAGVSLTLYHASPSSNPDRADLCLLWGVRRDACSAEMTEQRQARLDEAEPSPLLKLPVDSQAGHGPQGIERQPAACSVHLAQGCSALGPAKDLNRNNSQETAFAHARLLNRVCSSSPPGQEVYFDTARSGNDGTVLLLPILLQPGISLGGLSNVTLFHVGL